MFNSLPYKVVVRMRMSFERVILLIKLNNRKMMRKIKTNQLLLGMAVLASAIGTAQTVNSGELSVSPGTIMSSVGVLNNTAAAELVNDGDLLLYSHYNNDGLVTFSPGVKTGMTRMVGSAGYQEISGTAPMELQDVEFNNGNVQPAFHLSNEVRISGKSWFQNGIVDGENYGGLAVFEDNATHINTDDASHIHGPVRKNGDDAFLFPVGSDNYYRYAAMSAPESVADAFTGKYFPTDPNTLYPLTSKDNAIDLISDTEYWTVDKTDSSSDVFLTLSWNENTTASKIFAAPYDEIHIVRWDDAQKRWIDEGGVANPATKEVSMLVAKLKNYGVFTLGRVKSAPNTNSDIVIHNAVSPDGDGLNDFFMIEGIENYPDNKVDVYDRWGVKVYETTSYNTNGNVFKGISEGRLTVKKGDKLPVGTYFYIVDVKDAAGGTKLKKAGYLYINY